MLLAHILFPPPSIQQFMLLKFPKKKSVKLKNNPGCLFQYEKSKIYIIDFTLLF